MHFIETIVRNPVKVSVGVLLVALFGVIALVQMPMQLTPEVQVPTLTVQTNWPNASPQEVEREIIQEQEEQLKSVEGITKMTSESKDSTGEITLEFLVGTDMSEALLLANTRLQQVRRYPVNADEPILSTANLASRPIAWFILSPRVPTREEVQAFQSKNPKYASALKTVISADNEGVRFYRLRHAVEKHPELAQLMPPNVDISKMRKFAEDVIEARFERVKGVSDSTVMGGREEEMQVIINPQKLASRRLTIANVRDALAKRNKDTSAGDYDEGVKKWVVRTIGQFRSAKDVADTIIAYQPLTTVGDLNGGRTKNGITGDERSVPVYVRDVADEVKLGYKEADGLVRRFGTERIAVNVQRNTGANVLDVMDGLRVATKELNEGVLKQLGLELIQVYDETEYIYSAVGLVQNNIVVGGFLTVAVLLLFLRSGRSTLVIALAIPTSIIGTFLVLYLMGRSLNVISLAGLAFAVGMLVDNAVVVLENIYRYYEAGETRWNAAVRGANEVWGAVLASTLTTLAVFVPVLFVQEEAGQLFRDIALAISAGIALSLIVSITLIPMATARILPKHRPQANADAKPGRDWLKPFTLFGNYFVNSIVRMNAWLQGSVLMRLGVVIGFVGASILLSLAMMPKVEYLPTGNRNLVFGILLPPPGWNLPQMMDVGVHIEEQLEPYWNTDPDSPEAAKLKYPIIGDYFYVARGRQLFLGLRSHDPQRAAELIPLIQKVGSAVPDTFVVASQSSLFERGLGAGRSIDIEITGPDLKRLVAFGAKIMFGDKASNFPKLTDVIPNAQARPIPSLDLSSPEEHVIPRREQAAEMKVSIDELGYAVAALVDGAKASDYFKGATKIDLTIHAGATNRMQPQALEFLPIATGTGELVPLKALADVYPRPGPEQINHRERQRAITIQVQPPANIALEDAIERIRKQIIEPMLRSGELQGGLYQINLSGTADKLDATWKALRINFLLALLITYLLLAALFESWLYPLVIIVSVPLGAMGGFVGLWLLNLVTLQSLDVLTMLGFVILIGTVVNNPILIVKQSLIHMDEEGMPMRQAILESVRSRIRPIFMTTTTTVFALLPLALFPGAGSELYRGLGVVVLGGLLFSTLVTLIIVPTLFSLTMEAKEWLKQRLGIEDE